MSIASAADLTLHQRRPITRGGLLVLMSRELITLKLSEPGHDEVNVDELIGTPGGPQYMCRTCLTGYRRLERAFAKKATRKDGACSNQNTTRHKPSLLQSTGV
jgi:hypothetical protein